MVEIAKDSVQVSVLSAEGKPVTWAHRDGKSAEVPSDLAYVDQATFDVSRFNISNVGGLFRAAASMSGSEEHQSLTIVDYSGGEVVMSVSTLPGIAHGLLQPRRLAARAAELRRPRRHRQRHQGGDRAPAHRLLGHGAVRPGRLGRLPRRQGGHDGASHAHGEGARHDQHPQRDLQPAGLPCRADPPGCCLEDRGRRPRHHRRAGGRQVERRHRGSRPHRRAADVLHASAPSR